MPDRWWREDEESSWHTARRMSEEQAEREKLPTSTEFLRPDLAPPKVLAANRRTVLRRFNIHAVTYAQTRKQAGRLVDQSNLYYEAAHIVEEDEALLVLTAEDLDRLIGACEVTLAPGGIDEVHCADERPGLEALLVRLVKLRAEIGQ